MANPNRPDPKIFGFGSGLLGLDPKAEVGAKRERRRDSRESEAAATRLAEIDYKIGSGGDRRQRTRRKQRSTARRSTARLAAATSVAIEAEKEMVESPHPLGLRRLFAAGAGGRSLPAHRQERQPAREASKRETRSGRRRERGEEEERRPRGERRARERDSEREASKRETAAGEREARKRSSGRAERGEQGRETTRERRERETTRERREIETAREREASKSRLRRKREARQRVRQRFPYGSTRTRPVLSNDDPYPDPRPDIYLF